MFKRVIRSLALVSLVSTALLAQREPPSGRPDKAPGGPLGRCLAVVALSEAQKASVKSVFEQSAPATKALHEQLRADHEALRAALEASTPDACRIGTAMLKVRATEKSLQTDATALQAKIEALLTSDQKLKFAGCIEGQAPPRPER